MGFGKWFFLVALVFLYWISPDLITFNPIDDIAFAGLVTYFGIVTD